MFQNIQLPRKQPTMELLKLPPITLFLACRCCLGLATLFLFVAHLNTTTGQIDWDDDDDPGTLTPS